MATGDVFNVDLALSYKQFCKGQNVSEISDEMINRWLNSVIDSYQYQIGVEEEQVMLFFKIPDTEEYREDIRTKNYKIAGSVKAHDLNKKTILFHYTLTFGSSIILPS